METLKNQFRTLFFILLIAGSLISCSKDDDNNGKDPNEVPNGGQATAVIGVDNQSIQFSTKSDNSFAGIVQTKIGENEIDQLVIVMQDDNSDVMIVAQAAPAPDTPKEYDLSKSATNDYFFTTAVALNGKNSSDDNIYGVGTYQQGEEVVIQSKGSFKITSVSNNNIKGSFEMTLYNIYDPNNAENAKEMTITEGTFDLPIVEIDGEDLGDLD